MTASGTHNHAAPEAAGVLRWLTIHDDLLRGLAHAISNRLATIAAASVVLDAGTAPEARFLDGLRSDAERLEALLHLLRQLPRRAEAALEPMLLTDAVDSACRLVEEHPRLRGRAIVVETDGDIMPVRAEPGAVVHAVAVALVSASRAGEGPLRVTLRTEGEVVCLAATPEKGREHVEDDLLAERDADVAAIRWLLADSQGGADALGTACVLRLPTLQASRRQKS